MSTAKKIDNLSEEEFQKLLAKGVREWESLCESRRYRWEVISVYLGSRKPPMA